MKQMKMAMFTVLTLGFIMFSAQTAFGLTSQHISMGGGLTPHIQGYNAIGVKGTGLYGTNTSKIVTGVKVRLQEGSYDASANNYAKKGDWTAKLSKVNNVIKTSYTTYAWRY